ncbi:MAG TPA: gephyrin-like molybdotransferase Glp [Arsenicitalea sp.]|jgi:molybdopterin molybdotransferase|nr:gephyrin-like molybdotransferase Glp [Arsenicitalea sp.]
MSLLSLDDALARIFAVIPAPMAETVPLAQARGRVLAAPLTAAHSQPPFDSSAMDGYAVHSDDVALGVSLRMIGTSQAGQRFVGMMAAGQCVRIFTGAPMPIGADAVIMQEQAIANGNEISFTVEPRPGQSVRRKGADFAEGDSLLPVGTVLSPAALMLAASANRATLSVTRRPRIAIIATGDELVRPGNALGPDQIVASNSFGLIAQLAPLAREIIDLGIVPDDRSLIEAALLRAFDAGVEVIITSGGASVGDRDYVQEVLLDLGVKLDFWKIAMRPGKPLMFGTRGKTLIFGLPGNPVSALVTANVVVRPALRALTGHADPTGKPLFLPLAGPLPANGERRHFLRGSLVTGVSGTEVLPISETDSAHISSLALAEVLIVHHELAPARQAGDIVETIPLVSL